MQMPDSPVDFPYLVMLRIDAEHESEVMLAIYEAIRAVKKTGVKVSMHGRARHDDGQRGVMVNVDDDSNTFDAEWWER